MTQDQRIEISNLPDSVRDKESLLREFESFSSDITDVTVASGTATIGIKGDRADAFVEKYRDFEIDGRKINVTCIKAQAAPPAASQGMNAEGTRIYVSNIPNHITQREDVKRHFEEKGPFGDDITDVWVARNPPGFAFIRVKGSQEHVDEFIAKYTGTEMEGRPIGLEVARSQVIRSADDRRDRGDARPRDDRRNDSDPEGTRLYVTNIPPTILRREELTRHFADKGPFADDITDMWVARNPPGFAFIRVKGSREHVEEFIAKYTGTELEGQPIGLEITKSQRNPRAKRERSDDRDRRDDRRDDRRRDDSRDRRRDDSRDRRRDDDRRRERRDSRDRRRDDSRDRRR